MSDSSCLLPERERADLKGKGAKDCPAYSSHTTQYGAIGTGTQPGAGELTKALSVAVAGQEQKPLYQKQHHRDFSRESGFETDHNRRSVSVSSFSSFSDEIDTWQCQIEELFERVEKDTTELEVDLKLLVADSEKREERADIDMTSTVLSVNAEEGEFTAITIQSQFVSVEDERKQYTSAFGLLCNLKREISRLKECLECECTRLRHLISTDTDTSSASPSPEDAQQLLDEMSERRDKVHQRLDCNLSLIMEQIDCIRHRNDIIIDGVRLRHNRRFSENPINKLIRKSPVNCVTWFHGVLFAALLVMICYMYLWSRASDEWTVYLRLIRSPLLILLLLYLYGINMKVWAMFKIDYVTIFSHPPGATPTPRCIFKMASTLTVLMALLGVGVIVSSSFSSKLPIKIIPMVMWLLLFVFLLNPFNIFLRKARLNFALSFVRILLAPLFFVYFCDFFLADQFNSSVTLFLDMQYLVCYIISHPWTGTVDPGMCTSSSNGIRPILTALPALWRFLQCLRCYYDTRNTKHLVNAGKYFSTFPVVVFATLFSVRVKGNIVTNFDFDELGWVLICWILTAVVHSLYTFAWDVGCDWGLWNFRFSVFERKLVYKRKAVYVLAIIVDCVLRFLWTAKLTLAIVWQKDSDLIFTGLVVAEMLRRFIWNFFRVEYAHVLTKQVT